MHTSYKHIYYGVYDDIHILQFKWKRSAYSLQCFDTVGWVTWRASGL